MRRQYCTVDNFLEAICEQLSQVLNFVLFIPSDSFTNLSGDEIRIHFGRDKGGQFMKFKFGHTIMNQPLPNSPDEFEIVGILDAEENPHNL